MITNRRTQLSPGSVASRHEPAHFWSGQSEPQASPAEFRWSQIGHKYSYGIVLAGLAFFGFLVFFAANPGADLKQVKWQDILTEITLALVLTVWISIARRINTGSINFLRFFLGCCLLIWCIGVRFYLHWINAATELLLTLQVILAISGMTLMTIGFSRWIHEYHSLIDQLESNVTRYRMLSETDSLTGLPGRGQFESILTHLLATQRTCSLILLDLDRLQHINDYYGEEFGDTAIEHTARLIRRQVREFDYAFRIGGEEFALILVDCPQLRIQESAQLMLDAIRNNAFYTDQDDSFSISASIGIGSAYPADTPSSLYRRVDSAVDQAKKDGRDRIVNVSEGAGHY